jgi:hypothetical protein
MTTTILKPIAGGTIADPDSVTAADRKLDTGFPLQSAYVMIANATDAVVYLVTADDALVSGRPIVAGGGAAYGPFQTGVDLWVYGTGTGDVHYSFDQTQSEG